MLALLPEDIWICLLDGHMDDMDDIVSVSETCQRLRSFTLPYIFRKLNLRGYAIESLISVPAYLDFLDSTKERIDILKSKPSLLAYVREVELSNWVRIPIMWELSAEGEGNGDTNANDQRLDALSPDTFSDSYIISKWLSTYEEVRGLIIQLSDLRKIRFHECGKMTHLGSFFPCDAGPLGPMVCNSRDTYCTGIEFETQNSTALSTFQCPDCFLGRLPKSNSSKLEQLYYFQLIKAFPGTLVAARFGVHFFENIQDSHFPLEFLSLRRLGVVINNNLSGNGYLIKVREFISQCPDIRVLETPNVIIQLPAHALPHLECISGPLWLVTGAVTKRPVHTVQIRPCSLHRLIDSSLVLELEKLKLSTVHIHTLDLVGTPLNVEALPEIAEALPHVKSLIVPWIRDITILDLETMLCHCLELLEPFKEVEFFRVASVPHSGVHFDLPEERTHFKWERVHPTLETILLGREIRFVWLSEGVQRGWLFDSVPTIVAKQRSPAQYGWTAIRTKSLTKRLTEKKLKSPRKSFKDRLAEFLKKDQ